MKADFFLRTSLYILLICQSAVSFSKLLFTDACLTGNFFTKRITKQFYEFKMASGNLIICADSTLKTLFVYNCKNIFVHFSEKTNLLFRMDNKLRFSEGKMQ